MHLERKHRAEKKPGFRFAPSWIAVLLALAYAIGAVISGWGLIAHSRASTDAIDQILARYSMQNAGAQALERFDKAHPFLGFFISSPIQHNMELPSAGEADHAVYSEARHFLKTVRLESSTAAWWSWYLLNLSLFYVVLMLILDRSFFARSVIFSLTCVAVTFFVIGILAPAMVIWTAPTIPMSTGNLEFVLQHQVRGIAAIIKELLTTGHWVVGGFLLLFSIVTPLTKASLTFFATGCQSRQVNYRIGQVLHSIGKWSMADVFVAGILLSLYALKTYQATKSIPCVGIYYFTGYCLLSMTTSEILVHSGIVAGNEEKAAKQKFGLGIASMLFAIFLCFVGATSAYTYQQYTLNTKQPVKASGSAQKLDNADLVLPVHK